GSIEAIRLKRNRDEFLRLASLHAQYETLYRSQEKLARDLAESCNRMWLDQNTFNQKYAAPFTILYSGSVEPKNRKPPVFEFDDRPYPRSLSELIELAEQHKTDAAQDRDRAAMFAQGATYHAALKKQYARAANRPWSSVGPVPPPPV